MKLDRSDRKWTPETGVWFRGVLVRHEGHIQSGGVDKDVAFMEEADPEVNDQIDSTYRTKYQHYAARYVNPMVEAEARAATIKLVARSPGS